MRVDDVRAIDVLHILIKLVNKFDDPAPAGQPDPIGAQPMNTSKLGQVEEMVLLAALRLGEEAYSVTIIEEVARRTRRSLSHGAVFVALRRLEEKELIATHRGAPRATRGGRPPLLVTVRPAAVQLLRENRDALMNLWQDISHFPDA